MNDNFFLGFGVVSTPEGLAGPELGDTGASEFVCFVEFFNMVDTYLLPVDLFFLTGDILNVYRDKSYDVREEFILLSCVAWYV